MAKVHETMMLPRVPLENHGSPQTCFFCTKRKPRFKNTIFFLFSAFSGRYVCNNFRVNSSDLKEPDLGGIIIIGNSSQHAPSVRFG